MDLSHAIVLALVQGITEFLPISSSAHLILAPRLLGWPDQGLALDVAVHVGTLIAVVAYFRATIWRLLKALPPRASGTDEHRLAWALGIATVPAALAGLVFGDWIEANLRSPLVIAATTIAFGLVLWFADARRGGRSLTSLGWGEIILIGLAQALALVPGTSRSGITMTAALLLGLDRENASRFSFLLAVPVIALAGGYATLKLATADHTVDWTAVGLATTVSAVFAYSTIHLFLRFVARVGMGPFVAYRVVLGLLLFWLFA
ncbi:MAG: undecaprenyl-diphosphate phosphatase [Chromatiales bacterium]|nr:undecaprenyl-diphosphate phosphatase [Chromatiales bacterium]